MPSLVITQQPASLTAVPGQDVLFTVTASADFSAVVGYKWNSGQTSQTINIDPLMTDNGNTYTVTVSALSSNGSSLVFQASAVSDTATLTVQEDEYPYNLFDRGPETGKERHRRKHLLGFN